MKEGRVFLGATVLVVLAAFLAMAQPIPQLINYQGRLTDDAGLPVSEIEPISDRGARDAISRVIKEAESISQIEFW